jgi:hypothetical protein
MSASVYQWVTSESASVNGGESRAHRGSIKITISWPFNPIWISIVDEVNENVVAEPLLDFESMPVISVL